MNEETITIEQLIKDAGISMECSHNGTRDEEYKDGQGRKQVNTQDVWLCTLTRGSDVLLVPFYTGLGHRKLNTAKFRHVQGYPINDNERAMAHVKLRPAVWLKVSDPVKPKVEDILDCMASDSSGYDDARNFEDWAANYGYDEDSRKAEKIYQECAEQAKKLRHFMGDLYETLLYKVERL